MVPSIINKIPVLVQGSSVWSLDHTEQSEWPNDFFQLKSLLWCEDREFSLWGINTSHLDEQSGLCHHRVTLEGWVGNDIPAIVFYGTSEKYTGRLACFTGFDIFLMN